MIRSKDKNNLQFNKVINHLCIQLAVLGVVFFLELARFSVTIETKNMVDNMTVKLPDIPTFIQSAMPFASAIDMSQIISVAVVVCTIIFVVVSLPLIIYFCSSEIREKSACKRKPNANKKSCSLFNFGETYKIQSKYLC